MCVLGVIEDASQWPMCMLALQREVLGIRLRVLPVGHPNIATSMSNLAVACGELSLHEEAHELKERVRRL